MEGLFVLFAISREYEWITAPSATADFNNGILELTSVSEAQVKKVLIEKHLLSKDKVDELLK